MQLALQASKLASSMRQMSDTLNALKEKLHDISNLERNLRESRHGLTEAEESLERAKIRMAKCEADIRVERCGTHWDFVSRTWVEVAAGYPMLAILSSCPD